FSRRLISLHLKREQVSGADGCVNDLQDPRTCGYSEIGESHQFRGGRFKRQLRNQRVSCANQLKGEHLRVASNRMNDCLPPVHVVSTFALGLGAVKEQVCWMLAADRISARFAEYVRRSF